MIKLRKSLPVIGWGNWKILPVAPQVLALQYDWEGESVITLHNFSAGSKEVTLKDLPEGTVLQNLLKNEEQPAANRVTLKGYEYRWYKQKKLPANH
jgi:maltose alpha-D-glucosyltransferase/alpha-amylase